MKINQLPLFLRRKFDKATQTQTIKPVAPTAESSVMRSLPAYLVFLQSNKYSESTMKKYFADLKSLSLLSGRKK